MDEFVQSVMASFGLSALFVVGLLYLTKTWLSEHIKNNIKNEYDEKFEAFKVKLNAATDIELERLRSQLTKAATEHQVRFAKHYCERQSKSGHGA